MKRPAFCTRLLLSAVALSGLGIWANTASAVDLAWDCVNTPDGGWQCKGVPKAPKVEPAKPPMSLEDVEVVEVPSREEEAAAKQRAAEEAEKPAPAAVAEEAKPADSEAEVQRARPDKKFKPSDKEAAEVAEEKPAAPEKEVAEKPAKPPKDKLAALDQADDTWALCATTPTRTDRPKVAKGATELTADEVEIIQEGVSTFAGNVRVISDSRVLDADRVVYDKPGQKVEASGNVHYQDDNMSLKGTKARMNLETDQSQWDDAAYTLYDRHGRGVAKTVKREEADKLKLEQVTYTTCDPQNQDWELSTDNLELNTAENVGVARNVTVRFKGVPIMYSPYLSFPLSDERKSGFLTPSIGSSDDSGFTVSAPYYFNLAPNRDFTLVPTLYEKRGLKLGGEFRYLDPSYEGIVSLEYLPSDNEYDNEDRYAVSLKHHHKFTDRWTADLDFNHVSDTEYFDDFSDSLTSSSQSLLRKQLRVNYRGDNWKFRGAFEGYQSLNDNLMPTQRPYYRLPHLQLDGYYPDGVFGLTYGVNNELVYFDRDDSVTGTRLNVSPYVSLPMERTWGYITPKLAVSYTQYDLDNATAGIDSSASRTLPIVSVDSGLFFDRDTTLFGTNYIHTLEPRAFYLYVPEEDQTDIAVFDTGQYDFSFGQLFRENRFSGPDRIGDANQLTLALTSRLIDAASGRERLRASIGQIYYFRDRDVVLPGEPIGDSSSSDYVAEMFAQLTDNWAVLGFYQGDNDNSEPNRSSVSVRYRRDNEHILNMSYRYARDLLEQTDIATRWQLTRNIYGVARWNYSIRDQRTLEGFAGFEYDACCWALRLVGRRWFDELDTSGNEKYDNAIYLQLELKGLGNFGDKVENLLEEGILGYRR